MDLMFIFLIVFGTFGLSSAWLYSPGFEDARTWWLENTGEFAPLAYCQLCCSFWFAVLLSLAYAVGLNFTCLWLSAAGISWLLGAITNFFLWGKAKHEQELKD